MTREEIRATVLRLLGGIAPEAELDRLKPDIDIRRQIDIDSMDFLNFVIAVHGALGVEIPEEDYPHLASLDGAVDYLAAAVAARDGEPRPGGGAAR